MWLLKYLYQSTEEKTFISNNQSISGENFRFYSSLLQITVV